MNCLNRIKSVPMPGVEQAYWLETSFTGSAVYRLELELDSPLTTWLAVAAIPAFRIEIDGEFAANSFVQPTPMAVFYETFRLVLDAGRHVLEILVIDYHGYAPRSRIDTPRGLFCFSDAVNAARLNSGHAPWHCKSEPRFSFSRHYLEAYHCVGGRLTADYTCTMSDELVEPHRAEPGIDAWRFRQTEISFRRLAPARVYRKENSEITGYALRQVDSQAEGCYRQADNLVATLREPFAVPAHTVRRILIDLADYYCVEYTFRVNGGRNAEIAVTWAEGLFTAPEHGMKTNRNDIDGLYLQGLSDRFIPSGQGDLFFNLDYRAGRYVEIIVRTAGESLQITDLVFRENRYPLTWDGKFDSTMDKLGSSHHAAFRALQMCCHDTYMDCPYYEQMMYSGDGRLQLLATYVTGADQTPVDNAIMLWNEGQLHDGLFRSIYPARTCQVIPGFSLIYLLAVSDYICWRNLPEIAERVFPAAVRGLMAFEPMIGSDGLLRVKRGWQFMDWVDGWENGVPPDEDGVSGIFNALYLYVLREFAGSCRRLTENELAARFERIADRLGEKIVEAYYDRESGLFSDLRANKRFSEHMNALMLLAARSEEFWTVRLVDALFQPVRPLTMASWYFSFYYLEAAYKMNRAEAFLRRLQNWFTLEELGLKTTPETAEPSRSDCHGWSAHILYHTYASLLGIRPHPTRSNSWTLSPLLVDASFMSGEIPHQQGTLSVTWRRGDCGDVEISYKFPASQEVYWQNRRLESSMGTIHYREEKH